MNRKRTYQSAMQHEYNRRGGGPLANNNPVAKRARLDFLALQQQLVQQSKPSHQLMKETKQQSIPQISHQSVPEIHKTHTIHEFKSTMIDDNVLGYRVQTRTALEMDQELIAQHIRAFSKFMTLKTGKPFGIEDSSCKDEACTLKQPLHRYRRQQLARTLMHLLFSIEDLSIMTTTDKTTDKTVNKRSKQEIEKEVIALVYVPPRQLPPQTLFRAPDPAYVAQCEKSFAPIYRPSVGSKDDKDELALFLS